MKIQKRDGRVVPYEEDKIREAIHKANNEVEERYRASEGLIEEILEDVQQEGTTNIPWRRSISYAVTREVCSANPTPRMNLF